MNKTYHEIFKYKINIQHGKMQCKQNIYDQQNENQIEYDNNNEKHVWHNNRTHKHKNNNWNYKQTINKQIKITNDIKTN